MPRFLIPGFALMGAFALAILIAYGLEGCSTMTQPQKDAAWTVLKDASGVACAIVLQSLDPSKAPLCTTLPELEEALKLLTSGAPAGAAARESALYDAVVALRAQKARP